MELVAVIVGVIVASRSGAAGASVIEGLLNADQWIRFVNVHGTRSLGRAWCNPTTSECTFWFSSSPATVYRIDPVTAVLVVEQMLLAERPPPPLSPGTRKSAEAFRYEDPRLGGLTGKEEPVAHSRVWPQKESEINTTFALYYGDQGGSDGSPAPQQQLTISQSGKQRLPTENGKPVCRLLAVAIPGFQNKIGEAKFQKMKENYLQFHAKQHQRSTCFLLVDWSRGAALSFSNIPALAVYAQPAVNTITVGRQTGLLLYQLVTSKQIDPKDIHVIGFSLGAQVSHFTARWFRHLMAKRTKHGMVGVRACNGLKEAKNEQLARITGLDPAARAFQGYFGAYLDRADASFVDIIHTSSVECRGDILDTLTGRLGFSESVGHVDVYPNGGSPPQPGCPVWLLRPFGSCSHGRAVNYFIDSINSTLPRMNFAAIPCQNYRFFPSDCYPTFFALDGQVSAGKKHEINFMGEDAAPNLARGYLFLNYSATAMY